MKINFKLSAVLTALVLIALSMSGCVPSATPSPVLPTIPPSPLPATVTSSPVPPTLIPTVTPAPISTVTLAPLTVPPQISAIEKIRTDLELPRSALSFVEKKRMANSSGGNLEVLVYQDADGRKYSVDPEANQVVEIDARILLPRHGDASPQTFSLEVLKARALKYMPAVIPDFENRKSAWRYEEGGKGGDTFFFTWYGDIKPGAMNRPFIQLGFHKNGLLFAYYNTLTTEK
jgi:hypothetical protein